MNSMINFDDKIFIAGHNGMVGKAIYKLFKKEGYKNLLTIDKKDLDLTDSQKVKAWFIKNKPEIVVLAAAIVGGINANNKYPTKFILDNLKIQNNVIENSWLNGTKRFLFLGSSCIYPKEANQPIKEEFLMCDKLEPTNQWYAIAKISGIHLCNALRIEHNFNAISLMPTNLYGPGDNYHIQNSHVLPAFIRRFHEAKLKKYSSVTCWGSGKPFREFLHVSDLADACLHALKFWDPLSKNAPRDDYGEVLGILNVGTGIDLTIKDLATKIANHLNFEGEIIWDLSKPDGTLKKQLDVSRMSKLGWKPKINIDEGIIETIKQYEEEVLFNKLRS